MKKISLVELSQMKDKPKEVIFNKTKFEYSEAWDGYYFEGDSLVTYVKLYELNLPLIEIEEEPLLTNEERDFLESYVKFFGRDDISRITRVKSEVYVSRKSTYGNYLNTTKFLNLDQYKEYTLEELGL